MIPRFASAERAWENANPYDGECDCEGEGFMCDECGSISDTAQPCPELDCYNIDAMREMTREELAEHFPSRSCPAHGWCSGCLSPRCPDCGDF